MAAAAQNEAFSADELPRTSGVPSSPTRPSRKLYSSPGASSRSAPSRSKRIKKVEVGSVRDYVRRSRVADLHAQLQRCDGILAEMGAPWPRRTCPRRDRSRWSESRSMATNLKPDAAEAKLGGF